MPITSFVMAITNDVVEVIELVMECAIVHTKHRHLQP
jgi:hypothetical protein